MLLINKISYLNRVKFLYKIILFLIVLLFLPNIFKFFDHVFQKYFSLNRYINIFDFIFFSFFTICLIKKNKIKHILSVPMLLFFGYIFFARISIFLSEGEIHHRAYYELFQLFIVLLLFFSFFTKFFKKNYENIIKVFLVIIFTIALFESLVGILQFLLQRPLGFSILKEPLFGVGVENSATIYLSENKQFFFNKLLNNQSGVFLRAHGTFIHPNIFSGFLNISSILTLFLIFKSKKKIIFSFFLLLQITALIFTFSRAGLASFVLCSFVFFFLMLIKKHDVKKMGLIFIALFLLIVGIFSKYLLERGFIGDFFQSKKAKEMNIGSSNTRVFLKEASLNMIKNKPFFGIGFRNFLIKENEYSTDKLERAYVHNIYLLIASETGLIALLIFLIMIGIILIDLIRYSLNPLNIAIACCVMSFLLIGFFDHYPISSYFGRIFIFTFLGFLNYSIKVNKLSSYSQKVFLYQ